MRHPFGHKALAIAFSATLAASGVPTIALAASSAELQAQLSDAQATLQTMAEEAAMVGENLNDTLYQLEQTKEQITQTAGEIETKQAELKEAQQVLSDRVSSNYKTGGISLLSLVLQSSSFEEFVSNVYYADKVSARDAEVIETVKVVRAELQEKKDSLAALESEQSELAEQQKAQKAELDERQAAQQSYVNGLSAEVQAQLEAERQAEIARQEAARQAAQEAAAREAAEADSRRQQQEDSGDTTSNNSSSNTSNTNTTSSNSSNSSSGGGSSSRTTTSTSTTTRPTSTPAPSGNVRQTIVNAAYSQLGVPYVYGASSPGVAFDCSGFTSWCYAQAGISLPHSSAGQAGYIKSTGNLQPGDLVVWLGGVNSGSGNHVALYVGNGTIVHANGTMVVSASLSGRSAYTIAGSVL